MCAKVRRYSQIRNNRPKNPKFLPIFLAIPSKCRTFAARNKNHKVCVVDCYAGIFVYKSLFY